MPPSGSGDLLEGVVGDLAERVGGLDRHARRLVLGQVGDRLDVGLGVVGAEQLLAGADNVLLDVRVPAQEWGGQPVDSDGTTAAEGCTNRPREAESAGYGDELHYVTEDEYGGHADLTRANPTGADVYDENGEVVLDITEENTPVPESEVDPIECEWQHPEDNNSIAYGFDPTGGIDEYTASNLDGELAGDLLVVEYGSTVLRVQLNDDGDDVVDVESLASVSGVPRITAQGDDGIFPGTIWTADRGTNGVIVLEPADYDPAEDGTGYEPISDENENGDGSENGDDGTENGDGSENGDDGSEDGSSENGDDGSDDTASDGGSDDTTSDDASDDETNGSDDTIPGPGILRTLASLGGANYVLKRRFDGDETDETGDETL